MDRLSSSTLPNSERQPDSSARDLRRFTSPATRGPPTRYPHPLPSCPLPEAREPHRARRRCDDDRSRHEHRADEWTEEMRVVEKGTLREENPVVVDCPAVEDDPVVADAAAVEAAAADPSVKASAIEGPGSARQQRKSGQKSKSKAQSSHTRPPRGIWDSTVPP